MDLTQIHWLYKLAIISVMYIGLINISFFANIIASIIDAFGFRYSTTEKIIIGMGILAFIAYALIACAAIRLVVKMFWG